MCIPSTMLRMVPLPRTRGRNRIILPRIAGEVASHASRRGQ